MMIINAICDVSENKLKAMFSKSYQNIHLIHVREVLFVNMSFVLFYTYQKELKTGRLWSIRHLCFTQTLPYNTSE